MSSILIDSLRSRKGSHKYHVFALTFASTEMWHWNVRRLEQVWVLLTQEASHEGLSADYINLAQHTYVLGQP